MEMELRGKRCFKENEYIEKLEYALWEAKNMIRTRLLYEGKITEGEENFLYILQQELTIEGLDI